MTPLERLKYRVTGAVARGEAEALIEVNAVTMASRKEFNEIHRKMGMAETN